MDKKMRNYILIGTGILLVAVLCVFAGYMAVQSFTSEEALSGGSAADASVVAVSMKDGDIMLPTAKAYYESLLSEYVYYGYDTTDESLLEHIRTAALQDLAYDRVVQDKILEYGFDAISDEDIALCREKAQAEYDLTLEEMKLYYEDGVATEEEILVEVLLLFEEYNFTLETLEAYYIEELPYERLFDLITQDIAVSDDQVYAEFMTYVEEDRLVYENDLVNYELATQYYGEEVFYVPEGYRGIKHILLGVPEDIQAQLSLLSDELIALQDELYALDLAAETATAAPEASADPEAESLDAQAGILQGQIDAKQAEIEALQATIPEALQPTVEEIQAKLADGADFDALVEEYGTDPGMMQEPAKTDGYAVHAESILYDGTFQAAAMALENIGDVSGPITTGFGVHILQYTSDIPGGAIELTDALREAFRETLESDYKSTHYNEVIQGYGEAYDIVFYPEVLK